MLGKTLDNGSEDSHTRLEQRLLHAELVIWVADNTPWIPETCRPIEPNPETNSTQIA